MVAVYDGRACLGHVLGRGKAGFEAFDADNRSLGIFPSQREAAAAISLTVSQILVSVPSGAAWAT